MQTAQECALAILGQNLVAAAVFGLNSIYYDYTHK